MKDISDSPLLNWSNIFSDDLTIYGNLQHQPLQPPSQLNGLWLKQVFFHSAIYHIFLGIELPFYLIQIVSLTAGLNSVVEVEMEIIYSKKFNELLHGSHMATVFLNWWCWFVKVIFFFGCVDMSGSPYQDSIYFSRTQENKESILFLQLPAVLSQGRGHYWTHISQITPVISCKAGGKTSSFFFPLLTDPWVCILISCLVGVT